MKPPMSARHSFLESHCFSCWNLCRRATSAITAFASLFLLMLSVCVLVMEIEEESYMRNTIRSSSEGELTSFHQLGALLSGVAALLLFLNERFWGLIPGRKEEKEGTLWVRVILLVLALEDVECKRACDLDFSPRKRDTFCQQRQDHQLVGPWLDGCSAWC